MYSSCLNRIVQCKFVYTVHLSPTVDCCQLIPSLEKQPGSMTQSKNVSVYRVSHLGACTAVVNKETNYLQSYIMENVINGSF